MNKLDTMLKELGFVMKYNPLEPGIVLENRHGDIVDKFLTEQEIFVWLCGYQYAKDQIELTHAECF